MPNTLVQILLFLSSYFPLSVMLFLLLLSKHQTNAAIAVLSLGIVGLVGLSLYLKIAAGLSSFEVKVARVTRKDGEAMSYIVTYLLPFLSVPLDDVLSVVNLLIFLIVLAILYVNSEMLHINPMLNLSGYHIYEVEVGDATKSLIARSRIFPGAKISVVESGEQILLEIKR